MYGFIDTSSGANDVCTAELFASGVEHALQLRPFSNVGFAEDSPG